MQEMQNLQEQQKLQQQVEQIETIAKQHMTQEAISRYGNLKSAHAEKALQSIAIIVQMINQGQIKEQITDEQYKQLLLNITEKKREFKITRR